MFVANQDTKVVCRVGGDDSVVFVQVLLNYLGEDIHTLEFVDITKEFSALWSINDYLKLYNNQDDLKKDLSASYLQQFLKNPIKNDKLELLFKAQMEARHRQGTCGDNCALCNPDLGEVSFPNFLFDIKTLDVGGTG